MEYTEKYHAKRLLKMFEKKDPCNYCPTGLRFSASNSSIMCAQDSSIGQYSERRGVCIVCQDFVGIEAECPCMNLGQSEAIKRTWLALEAKGYI